MAGIMHKMGDILNIGGKKKDDQQQHRPDQYQQGQQHRPDQYQQGVQHKEGGGFMDKVHGDQNRPAQYQGDQHRPAQHQGVQHKEGGGFLDKVKAKVHGGAGAGNVKGEKTTQSTY